MKSTHLVSLLVPFALLACGGESFSEPDDDDAGEGGTTAGTGSSGKSGGRSGSAGKGSAGDGSGGSGTAGTGVGGTGVAGGAATGGTGVVCCAAAPTCPAGEHEVSGFCTAGACHPVTVCCSTIWCIPDVVQCNAFPSCDAGDTELTGACPPDVSCYQRSLCGSTIWCLDQTCNPETEYNRQYLFESCAAGADWDCPTSTKMFENECGCGCEQDPLCPDLLPCYVPLPAEDRAPGMGGQQGEAPPLPPPGGFGNVAGSGGAELPYCTDEPLRCPFSKTY